MEMGELIKSLRLERQLTQANLAEGITTRPTLASIENRNNSIDFDILLNILNRLNIRIEEFIFLLQGGFHSTKQTLYAEVYSEYYSKGYISEKLENKLLIKYEEKNDFFYIALYTQMLGIRLRKQEKISLEEEKQLNTNIALLKNHLNIVTNWSHMELALFTNCLYLFEDSYIQAVYKRVLKKILSRKKLRLYHDDILVFFLNCIKLFLERDQLLLVKYFLEELKKELTQKDQLYEKTLYEFYQAILDIRMGETNSEERIIQILNYLNFLEEKSLAQALTDEFKKYIGYPLEKNK